MIYLNSIDNEIKKKILVTLKEIITKYPSLNHSISLISDGDYLIDYVSSHYKKSLNLEQSCKDDATLFTTTAQWNSTSINMINVYSVYDFLLRTRPDFIGIGVNKRRNYEEVTAKMQKGYNLGYTYSRNIRDVIYHEIGHVFSILFKMSNITMVKNMLDENIRTNKDISVYSKNNPEEMIAEAFSKYSYDPKYNNLVYLVGSIIEEFYYEFENTDLFDINRRVYFK